MLVALPAQAGDQININSASVGELQTVKGIGPKTAAAIVAYREANGSFSDVGHLENVKGIGSKELEKIVDELTVGKSNDGDDHHQKDKQDS